MRGESGESESGSSAGAVKNRSHGVDVSAQVGRKPQLSGDLVTSVDNCRVVLLVKKLSDRRVKTVRDTLTKAGVEANRLRTFALGEDAPVCDAKSEDCWQQNRRVDVFTRPRS